MRAAALCCLLLLSGCLTKVVTEAPALPDNAPYLLADRYPELRIAVHHVEGWAPSQLALDGVRDEVLRATGRTSLSMGPSQVLPVSAGADDLWSGDELRALLDHTEPEDQTTIVLAFLDGGIERTDDVTPWGTALGESALVFVERFNGQGTLPVGGLGSVPRLNRPEVERAVAIHEVGHVLGLVAQGVPRSHGPRSTDECRCHSGDPESVMYREADSDANPAFLAGVESSAISYRFTDDDIADVRAFQVQHGFRPRP